MFIGASQGVQVLRKSHTQLLVAVFLDSLLQKQGAHAFGPEDFSLEIRPSVFAVHPRGVLVRLIQEQVPARLWSNDSQEMLILMLFAALD